MKKKNFFVLGLVFTILTILSCNIQKVSDDLLVNTPTQTSTPVPTSTPIPSATPTLAPTEVPSTSAVLLGLGFRRDQDDDSNCDKPCQSYYNDSGVWARIYDSHQFELILKDNSGSGNPQSQSAIFEQVLKTLYPDLYKDAMEVVNARANQGASTKDYYWWVTITPDNTVTPAVTYIYLMITPK